MLRESLEMAISQPQKRQKTEEETATEAELVEKNKKAAEAAKKEAVYQENFARGCQARLNITLRAMRVIMEAERNHLMHQEMEQKSLDWLDGNTETKVEFTPLPDPDKQRHYLALQTIRLVLLEHLWWAHLATYSRKCRKDDMKIVFNSRTVRKQLENIIDECTDIIQHISLVMIVALWDCVFKAPEENINSMSLTPDDQVRTTRAEFVERMTSEVCDSLFDVSKTELFEVLWSKLKIVVERPKSYPFPAWRVYQGLIVKKYLTRDRFKYGELPDPK